MELENIYNGNIAVVDLEAGEIEEIELDEELVEKYLGGAALNTALYKQYKDRDPVIIGAGPLTNTFTPSSCLVVMTGRSPLTGGICHVPLTWQASEFKLTGFDFIVLLGKSAKPVCLWLHDEIADLDDASATWGKSAWDSCDYLRTQYGDDFIQTIVIGPAAEAGSPLAQVSENYWGSKDVFALGALLGEKKVKGIAYRGLGSIEVAEGFFEETVNLKGELVNGHLKGKHGFKDMLGDLGLQDSLGNLFNEKQHRVAGGHADFFAANTFFMIDEDPKTLKESKKDEPGLLATDIAALAALRNFDLEIPVILKEMYKLGLAPVATAAVLAKNGVTEAGAAKGELKKLAASKDSPVQLGISAYNGVVGWPAESGEAAKMIQTLGLFSNAIPPQSAIGDFKLGDDPQEIAKWWIRRQGIAYILGIDPLVMIMAPEFTEEKLSELLQIATDEEEISESTLIEVVRDMIKEGLSILPPTGEVSADLKAGDPEALIP